MLSGLLAVAGSAAASSGSISGVVSDSRGVPIAGIEVVASGPGNEVASAVTAADGSYTISSLAAGAYWVLFEPPPASAAHDPDNYLSQYEAGVVTGSGSPPVTVQGGAVTSGIDAALRAGGTITGTVTDSADAPIQGATVVVAGLDRAGPPGVVSPDTASDGSFAVDRLPSGYYTVEAANHSGAAFLPTYFGETATASGAFGVAVSAGATTSGVAIRALPGAEISGSVTDGSGDPVGGEHVTAFDPSGSAVGASASSAADGSYLLAGLPSGSYRLEFNAPVPAPILDTPAPNYLTQFYDGAGSLAGAAPVSATAGSVTPNIDVRLAAGGEIQGTVTDASNKPIASADVTAYRSDGTSAASTGTASDGTYTLAALPAGAYRVGVTDQSASPPGHAPAFYGGSSLAGAATITVSEGAAKTGIDLQQAAGAVIAGTIEDSAGRPIDGATANAYDAAGDVVAGARDSPPTGAYSIGGLPAGTYRVGFEATGGDYAPQSVSGVTVASGAAQGGIDVQLAAGGHLAGSATTTSGAPISGLAVVLYDAGGSIAGFTTTLSDGAFQVTALGSGSYRIGFANQLSQPLVEPTFFGGSTLAAATPVAVSAGATTTVPNTELALVTGAVSGVVTDTSGEALADATVTLYDTSGNVVGPTTTTAADGSYSIAGVAPGFYRVGFSRGGYSAQLYSAQLYSHASSLPASQAFYVAAAQTASGVDAALAPAPAAPGAAVQPPPSQPLAPILPSVTLGRFLLLTATARAKLSHSHTFSVALRCLDAAGCDVRATASVRRHRRRVVIAAGAVRLKASANGRVKLRLTPTGVRLFRRDHDRLRVTVRVAIGVSAAASFSDSESLLVV
jgi:hypothetical protein